MDPSSGFATFSSKGRRRWNRGLMCSGRRHQHLMPVPDVAVEGWRGFVVNGADAGDGLGFEPGVRPACLLRIWNGHGGQQAPRVLVLRIFKDLGAGSRLDET